MIDVGVIGTGAIGSKVIRHVGDSAVPEARLRCVHNRTPSRAQEVLSTCGLSSSVEITPTPIAMAEQTDVVVEVASQAVVKDWATEILGRGTDLVAISAGAFRDETLFTEVRTVAAQSGSRMYVPSGAISCLDGVSAIARGPVEEVSLHCYRPLDRLEPYVDDSVNAADLADGDVVFDGTAAEAAEAFPAHMNVAIALSLTAGVDPSDVSVLVAVDRRAPRSRYVVDARGDAGSVEAEIRNFETENDPGQSALTVRSVLEKLHRISAPVVLGT